MCYFFLIAFYYAGKGRFAEASAPCCGQKIIDFFYVFLFLSFCFLSFSFLRMSNVLLIDWWVRLGSGWFLRKGKFIQKIHMHSDEIKKESKHPSYIHQTSTNSWQQQGKKSKKRGGAQKKTRLQTNFHHRKTRSRRCDAPGGWGGGKPLLSRNQGSLFVESYPTRCLTPEG